MLGCQTLRLGQTWEFAAWEIAHLVSCHLGKYPWEVAFGKRLWESIEHQIIIYYRIDVV